MPTEDDLRNLFASEPARNTVDARRVIAKTRARRLPRQFAAGAVGALAVVGITVVGIQSALPHQSVSTLSGAAPEVQSGQAFDSAAKRAPADKINLCAGSLAQSAPSFYGLQLDVTFPASATVGTDSVQGTVRLANTGQETVKGTTASTPAITLSQGGVVLWHSNGPASELAVAVDLAPGESLEYPASFSPVRCEPADDQTESFRAGLPPVPAGEYELSAAIDFMPDASMAQLSTPGLDLVTGPTAPIALK
jgi:hypothetical protein